MSITTIQLQPIGVTSITLSDETVTRLGMSGRVVTVIGNLENLPKWSGGVDGVLIAISGDYLITIDGDYLAYV